MKDILKNGQVFIFYSNILAAKQRLQQSLAMWMGGDDTSYHRGMGLQFQALPHKSCVCLDTPLDIS